MNELIDLWEKPAAEEIYMIAGWRQWADAGSISSALPEYLIDLTHARKIGEMKPYGYYLFQFPGTHHLLRPEIRLAQGYRQSLASRHNDFFYTGDEQKGLVIFLGDEPHLNVELYTQAFFDTVSMLNTRRVLALGGVYGAMPYDKEREISCVYSLPRLKGELADYAVKFSDYEGGSTIGTYLVDQAEEREIEFIDFYAFVPAYDFSQLSTLLQGIRVEHDYKAWYDVMRRVNHMFDLGLDLSDLQQKSIELITSVEAKIEELDKKMPQVKVREYLKQITEEFTEMPFIPLDEVWERELGDLLEDLDD
ncbi:MAG: PAC2 family protein [Chloroflexota bacterium]